MAKDIVMPKMGNDMTEGKLVHWIKHEGDTVTKGEPIVEIETDKVTVEVEAPDTGVLQRLIVQEDEMVPVGERIAVLVTLEENVAPPTHEINEAGAPLITSPLGATAHEQAASSNTVVTLAKPAHQGSSSDTNLLSEEQSSSGPRSEAASGTDHMKISSVNASWYERDRVQTPSIASAGSETRADRDRQVRASPLARRMAQEHGVNLLAVRGTGPGGRVMREDVQREVNTGLSTRAAIAAPLPAPSSLVHPPATTLSPMLHPASTSIPDMMASGSEQMLTQLQQTMACRMVESKTATPHFYLTIEVDMTEAVALRVRLNTEAEERIKISMNDLVVKAAAKALTRFPVLNASFAGDRLLLHNEISIAVAVALDNGLVTPVVRHADQKALGQIARETRGLAERARSGKSHPEDYTDGTFTISNLGMFHIDTFVAIINPPQAAIMAVGAVRRVPVYSGDTLVPRERMSITLSADHRVTDGATCARFLGQVRNLLEHPLRLLV